jgi:hypothetical protein
VDAIKRGRTAVLIVSELEDLVAHGMRAMSFRVQFLDGSSTPVADWYPTSDSAAGAIELLKWVHWPADAIQARIFDADGREVRSQ